MKRIIATVKIFIFLLCLFPLSAYCKPHNDKLTNVVFAAGDTIRFKADQLATSEDLEKAGGVSLKEMILQKFYGRGRTAGLIVLDGMEMPPGFDIDDLNACDIETVEAVYGPNAAIYGMRAGNGVWVITTKQGEDSD